MLLWSAKKPWEVGKFVAIWLSPQKLLGPPISVLTAGTSELPCQNVIMIRRPKKKFPLNTPLLWSATPVWHHGCSLLHLRIINWLSGLLSIWVLSLFCNPLTKVSGQSWSFSSKKYEPEICLSEQTLIDVWTGGAVNAYLILSHTELTNTHYIVVACVAEKPIKL